MIIHIALHIVISSLVIFSSKAGNCWYAISRNGRCTELLSEKIDKEDCCMNNGRVGTAWSPQDFDSGALFFWRVLGGGVPCSPCKDSCRGVVCDKGKNCVMKNEVPKCICAPECRTRSRHIRGPVCGTDGRSYRSLCRLRKKACRTDNPSLTVAYLGVCQRSCQKIKCPAGKYCLVDQNMNPHCVKCSWQCDLSSDPHRQVCGTDGKTYPNSCHIRQAACKKGKAIPIAYRGPCLNNASCDKIKCSENRTCLTNQLNGSPRCVGCNYKCVSRQDKTNFICGTNNRTYMSYCHMMQDACSLSVVIDTQYYGSCESKDSLETSHHNLDLVDGTSYFQPGFTNSDSLDYHMIL